MVHAAHYQMFGVSGLSDSRRRPGMLGLRVHELAERRAFSMRTELVGPPPNSGLFVLSVLICGQIRTIKAGKDPCIRP